MADSMAGLSEGLFRIPGCTATLPDSLEYPIMRFNSANAGAGPGERSCRKVPHVSRAVRAQILGRLVP